MKTQLGFLKRIWVLTPLMFIFNGCGGGGGGEEPSTPPPVAKVPTVSILSAPANPIPYGTVATITWSSTYATSCTEMAGAGFATAGATSGSDDSSELTEDTTFTLSCTGAGGTTNKSVTVMVAADPLVFRIGRHRLWPQAVYKDELPTAPITYQAEEMTLPEGWTAFVRFDRRLAARKFFPSPWVFS